MRCIRSPWSPITSQPLRPRPSHWHSHSHSKLKLKLYIPTPMPVIRHEYCYFQSRPITISGILVPPLVFSGLVVALWTYKCMMMVLFQNKIIYMPGVPPFSRSEKVSDYAKECAPVVWEEHAIRSGDGTVLKLLEGKVQDQEVRSSRRKVVILYFQGNASSTPPRLPYLSRILKQVHTTAFNPRDTAPAYSIVALAYRGFWTSSGRPSQKGIELDAAAALKWIFDFHVDENTDVVIWGQSIGAGVATTALSNLVASGAHTSQLDSIRGLLLETPFLDMASMLVAIYPQRFLPYRYLTPFLMSSWDSQRALVEVAESKKVQPVVMILQAGDDEIVPADHAGALEALCRRQGLSVERKVVTGALHTEIMAKSSGRVVVANFLLEMGRSKQPL